MISIAVGGLADGAAEGGCGASAGEEASVAGFLLKFALVVEGLAAEEGHPGLAVDFPAFVEGEAGVAVVVFGADGGLALGVDDGDVGVGADLEGTLFRVDAEDAGGVSDMQRASQFMGMPRPRTPSLKARGAMVSMPGEPKGTGEPSGLTKMFFQPGALRCLKWGAWSLPRVEM